MPTGCASAASSSMPTARWVRAARGSRRPTTTSPTRAGLACSPTPSCGQQAGEAAGNGYQLAIHAIGDAAKRRSSARSKRLGQRFRATGAGGSSMRRSLDVADLPRLAKARIVASMQPTHQTSDRPMAEARLGPNRLGGAYAWQTLARSGARLAFGSDFPVEFPNPFPGLAAAVSRQDMSGQPPGGWRPQERVSFAQALAGFTRGAAYAGFAERIGSLAPGTCRLHPGRPRRPTVAPIELAATQVLETWSRAKGVGRAGSAGRVERGREHRRGQDLRQFLRLGLAGSYHSRAGPRRAPRLSRKRVIAGSPLVQSPTRLDPGLANASRTSSRSIAAASLTLQVRHQSAVK